MRSYETRSQAKPPSPLSVAQTRNTVLTRRERYMSAAANVTLRLDCLQLLGFAYLHGLSRAWSLSRIITRRSLRKSFDREKRAARFPLRNATDNVWRRIR